MTSRLPLAVAPAATALLAVLLTGCAAPAAEAPTDPGAGSEGTTAPEPPAAEGPDLPAQTVGADTDCSFLADDQVTAVWGFDVVDLDISTVIEAGGVGGILYGCDWNQSDDGTGLTIGVEVRDYVSPDGATQYFADARNGADFDGEGGIVLEPVDGIGEEAGVLANANTADTPEFYTETLIVRSGTLLVQVTVTDITNGVTPGQYRDQLAATYEAAFAG